MRINMKKKKLLKNKRETDYLRLESNERKYLKLSFSSFQLRNLLRNKLKNSSRLIQKNLLRKNTRKKPSVRK